MPRSSFQRAVPLFVALWLLSGSVVRAESMHVFGIHFWDWGANVDVMSHRTGWVVECNALHTGAMPNAGQSHLNRDPPITFFAC